MALQNESNTLLGTNGTQNHLNNSQLQEEGSVTITDEKGKSILL
jgi:hypothetical protein